MLLDFLACGMTIEEILTEYPQLTHEDVLAALPQGREAHRRSGSDMTLRSPNCAKGRGYPLLVAAGLDHYGTLGRRVPETRAPLLERALRATPAGWQDKNLQILFRVEVVRDNVGTPSIAATYVW
jgi:hypothetical protein